MVFTSHPASAPAVAKARADIKDNCNSPTLATFEFILDAWVSDTTKSQIQEILSNADEYDAADVLAEIRRIVE